MKTSNKLILFLVQLQEHLGTTFKIVIKNFYILTVDEIKQKVLNQHFLDENHKKFVKDIDPYEKEYSWMRRFMDLTRKRDTEGILLAIFKANIIVRSL